MLTYANFHLTYILPVICVLALIVHPFINRSEIFKIGFISGIAVLYTTPWDNYIIMRGAWTFPADQLIAVIGYVPVEEYIFFVLQTVIVSLWHLLCARWSTPCLHFNHDKRSYQLIRWIPIAVLTAVMVTGYWISVPGTGTFYLGCIMWWIAPVYIFIWYGAGNYIVTKLTSSAVSVLVPTVYLCWIDQIALKANIWHINVGTSLNLFVAEDLPFEEALFFLLTSICVVLGLSCYDKARGMCETYSHEFPHRFGINLTYLNQMCRAFIKPEYAMSSVVTDDIKTSIEILREASKSFNAASFLFQSGIRLDLIILYAFCRVTDNIIDDETDVLRKKCKLNVIEKFVNELFADRKSDYDVKTVPYTAKVDWAYYQSELTGEEMASFRAVSRIAFYLPRKPFYELIAGYQWDIEGRLVRNEEDLLLYSSYVAGSVGTLCVYVMLYRCDNDVYDVFGEDDYVIEKARQMGRVLQLVNIARDIITDSETLGRCYVPTEYMDDEEQEIHILCNEKKPRSLGNKKLKKYSTRMIHLANKLQSDSVGAIRCLPRETRGSVLAATEIYRGLTSAIQSSQTYPTRASITKLERIFIGIYSLYVKSIQYVV
ncbi:Squalene/phytoene synthase, conserved site,Squalene/phytoene synthase,Lycopene cyclase [Cinara cedri]|uniref:Bifunctional lycopene cyclase/phytoene synthase n=1 Tax=Cinara cedri TaxID=506608 RepID=A0A5E4NBZ6_9HEMI|nr:Squalene/phytoene synthase, conserved site,Squalene/phytoene synthase,Lycopene cyclase [Cinara cedri]